VLAIVAGFVRGKRRADGEHNRDEEERDQRRPTGWLRSGGTRTRRWTLRSGSPGLTCHPGAPSPAARRAGKDSGNRARPWPAVAS
jgi:hypothetical protein